MKYNLELNCESRWFSAQDYTTCEDKGRLGSMAVIECTGNSRQDSHVEVVLYTVWTYQLSSRVNFEAASGFLCPFARAQKSTSSDGVEMLDRAIEPCTGSLKFCNLKPVLQKFDSFSRNGGSCCEYKLGLYEPGLSSLLVTAATAGLISTRG